MKVEQVMLLTQCHCAESRCLCMQPCEFFSVLLDVACTPSVCISSGKSSAYSGLSCLIPPRICAGKLVSEHLWAPSLQISVQVPCM